jgi:HlyD family secretion protein
MFLLISSLVIFFSFCSSKEELTKPVLQNITQSVYASGVVKSRHQYQVFSPVNGIIRQVHVEEGALVQRGAVLISLVNDAPKLNAENAEIALQYTSPALNQDRLGELLEAINFAHVKLQNDSMLFERQQRLWKNEIGSLNDLERRELAWKNAMSAYESAIHRYNESKKQIQFSSLQSSKQLQISRVIADGYVVRAQQSGKIYSLLKEAGEMVNTQMPIAVIGDADEFLLELKVDEFDIASVQPGQQLFITMDSHKGEVFQGIICNITPIMNESSRSFTVEASFTKSPKNLFPHLTAEANILIRTKENAITIPRSFITDESYVILKDGRKRKVEIGLKDYEKAEIISGLSKDDMIKKPAI